ncbi:hypothetical protein LUZ60_016005 [Juncus effusus]|nr:hypothetical protein LUZ60_016005 [Juncus effusus]
MRPPSLPGEVSPELWAACGGPVARAPHVGSLVYYFPEGHFEYSPSSRISDIPSPYLSRPFFLCTVLSVRLLADPDSDEVFSVISLCPFEGSHSSTSSPQRLMTHNPGSTESFSKVLTQSDANNGGGFSVPRSCADTIFPPLDLTADPPVQNLLMRDVHGKVFEFRHIYRGTPRRHLLTTGWARFVNEKKLIAGDTVVFIKNGRDLFIGVRRGPRFVRAHVAPEEVLNSIESAANGRNFEVVYYPRMGDGGLEFVVEKERVERAMMAGYWSVGLRVKMAVEAVDSVRTSVYLGTVSEIRSKPSPWTTSPWRALQVTWDDPEAVKLVRQVSPWQVEINQSIPTIHSTIAPPYNYTPPPLKRARTNPTSNDRFTPHTLAPCIQGARHSDYHLPSAVYGTPGPSTPLTPPNNSNQFFPDLEGSDQTGMELSRSSKIGTLMLFGKLIEFVQSDDSGGEGFKEASGDEVFLPGFNEPQTGPAHHTRYFTDLVLQSEGI